MIKLKYGALVRLSSLMSLLSVPRTMAIDIHSSGNSTVWQIWRYTALMHDALFDQIHYIKIRDWLNS